MDNIIGKSVSVDQSLGNQALSRVEPVYLQCNLLGSNINFICCNRYNWRKKYWGNWFHVTEHAFLFIPWRNASLYLVEGEIKFTDLVLFHSKIKYKPELSKITTLENTPPPPLHTSQPLHDSVCGLTLLSLTPSLTVHYQPHQLTTPHSPGITMALPKTL